MSVARDLISQKFNRNRAKLQVSPLLRHPLHSRIKFVAAMIPGTTSTLLDMHWSIYALLSAIFAALVAIFGKIGLQGVDSTLATTIRSMVMAIFLVGVSTVLGKFSFLDALNNKALIFIILSGVAGALSWLFYFFAIKTGPVSGVTAIDRTSVVFAFLLAVIFLSEAFTWMKALGAAFILAGAILMVL